MYRKTKYCIFIEVRFKIEQILILAIPMPNFEPFFFQQQNYDLSHLNAFYTEFTQIAKDNKSAKKYRCLIEFSTHCFTKSPNSYKGETLNDYSKESYYVSEKETRIFCLERYELSKQLPDILKNMDKQKCFFTSANDKFLTISVQNQQGEIKDYEIYFSLRKAKACDVHIFINSAYLRSSDYRITPSLRRKPISFFVLLHNTVTNKKINKPK